MGEPSSAPPCFQTPGYENVPQNDAENGSKIYQKNRAEEGYATANGTIASPVGVVDSSGDKANPTAPSSSGVSVSVPVPAVVRAVRTLSSPPFLRRGNELPSTKTKISAGGTNMNGGFTLRLQLSAVSVLKVLLFGDGAEYVLKASAIMSAMEEDMGGEVLGNAGVDKGDEVGDDMEDSGED